jgi:hypothetical protein
LDGYIALQAHSGPPFEVSYRKIILKELSEVWGTLIF